MKWYCNTHDMDFQPVVADEKTGATIAVCYSGGGKDETTPEDALFNAQLIAMAPDLLLIVKELAEREGIFHPVELSLRAERLINELNPKLS